MPMARPSRSKPLKQPAKKPAKPARSSSRKSPAKAAPARKATKAKAAPVRKAAKAKPASKKSSMMAPPHEPHTAEVRAAVARKRPASATHEETQAEHDHQDPRLAGLPGITHEGKKVQPENYGQFKTKAVARMDKPVNWFRRGAKPKS